MSISRKSTPELKLIRFRHFGSPKRKMPEERAAPVATNGLKNLKGRSRNQNSEYLAQRRKGRKEIKFPDLAFLASWREQIPVLDSHGPPEHRNVDKAIADWLLSKAIR